MKRSFWIMAVLLVISAGTGLVAGGKSENKGKQADMAVTDDASGGSALPLLEAVEQTAQKIAADLPKGSRVAIVAFESENDNLSDFMMEEITGALFDRGIEVADRQNLAYVYRELNLQMSGDVSDDTAQAVGRFLGAQLVITGQLQNIGNSYRYRTSAIHVEKATRDSVTRLNVRNDKETQNIVASLTNQKTTVRAAKYGVSEDKTPQTAGAFLDRGIMFASRSKYDMAIADFTEALKLDPNMNTAYVLRGRAWHSSVSQVTDVSSDFSSIIITSTGGKATADQARAFEQAISDYTAALRIDPNNVTAYNGRGVIYSNKGDYDKAITDYNQAIKINPNNAEPYNNRGNAYKDKGDYDKAIADFNQAIRLNPNYALAHNNRGLAYGRKGDYDRAITDYNQSIKLDSNFPITYYNRGLAYYNKSDFDKAIADYNQAIKLDPNFVNAYYNRGLAYRNKNDYDKAIADYSQAVRLNPNLTEAYIVRGSAYGNKGDFDKAIADFNQAINLNPNYAMAYYNRGVAYYNKANYDKAYADFEAVLRIDPYYAGATQGLEAARRARGR